MHSLQQLFDNPATRDVRKARLRRWRQERLPTATYTRPYCSRRQDERRHRTACYYRLLSAICTADNIGESLTPGVPVCADSRRNVLQGYGDAARGTQLVKLAEHAVRPQRLRVRVDERLDARRQLTTFGSEIGGAAVQERL